MSFAYHATIDAKIGLDWVHGYFHKMFVFHLVVSLSSSGPAKYLARTLNLAIGDFHWKPGRPFYVIKNHPLD